MNFDDNGKYVERILGQYLIQTTANVLYWSQGTSERFMTELVHLPVSSNSKIFLVEGNGYLLYNDTVGTFEFERLAGFEKFYFKQLGN